MTRPHPFDFAFRELAGEHFAPIQDTLGAPSIGDFVKHDSVTALLDQLAPVDADDIDPTIRGGMAQLLYAAYRFADAGERTVSCNRMDLPSSLDQPAPAPFPTSAAYVQLPDKLFWGQIADGAPHEPLDGVFVAPTTDTVLLVGVLGFHPDRMGFSQVVAEVTPQGWEQAASHVRRPPFAPLMDGGASMDLRSVASEAELIQLVRLALHSAGE